MSIGSHPNLIVRLTGQIVSSGACSCRVIRRRPGPCGSRRSVIPTEPPTAMGNLCGQSSHHCFCMCYCCLDEADKVALVMNRFAPTPASQALDGNLMNLVRRHLPVLFEFPHAELRSCRHLARLDLCKNTHLFVFPDCTLCGLSGNSKF